MHDAPDAAFSAMDIFCSEYGWRADYVKYELRMDEAAKLFHAILYRKGAKTYRKTITAKPTGSLAERLAAMQEIDTPPEVEGIIF